MFEALNDEAIDAKVREIFEANIKIALEREKAQEALEKEQPAVEAEKVGTKLRQWPEDVAAMPTELTRTSLFGLPSDKPGARKSLNDVKINSRSDVEVLYTGEELSAKDETCWLACLRLGRGVPIGQRIHFNKIDLLKELDLANSGQNWKTTEARLKRMSKAHLTVNFKRGGKSYLVTTGMLKYGIENETGSMYIRLDPDGTALLENLSYQPWNVRLSLKTDVAARILTYVSGHEKGKPHSLPLSDLKSWCGYGGRADKFRVVAMAALKELETKDVLVDGASKLFRKDDIEMICWVRQE